LTLTQCITIEDHHSDSDSDTKLAIERRLTYDIAKLVTDQGESCNVQKGPGKLTDQLPNTIRWAFTSECSKVHSDGSHGSLMSGDLYCAPRVDQMPMSYCWAVYKVSTKSTAAFKDGNRDPVPPRSSVQRETLWLLDPYQRPQTASNFVAVLVRSPPPPPPCPPPPKQTSRLIGVSSGFYASIARMLDEMGCVALGLRGVMLTLMIS